MRLHFEDLTRPKAAAKQLHALLAASRLSTVQEIIARASGYRDWHDLAANISQTTHAPGGLDLDTGIIARLADALNLDDEDVQHVVARTKLIDGHSWTSDRHAACADLLRRQRGRLSHARIAHGKAIAAYHLQPHHEHDDCIRIAYEWLDAQTKIKSVTRSTRPLKHIIEKWAGRYVSSTDVVVAAALHPGIFGEYPHFNISARLTEPSRDRLAGISEAFTHDYHERFNPKIYTRREDLS